jgi:hypothetical protein
MEIDWNGIWNKGQRYRIGGEEGWDGMSYKIGVPEMGKRGFSHPEEVH